MAARNLHLCVDIGTDAFDRAGGIIHALRSLKPDLKDVLDDLAVKILFGSEVIQQIGLGQTRHIRDQLHRSTAKARFGKYFLSRLQDERLVLLADLVAAQRLCGFGHRAGPQDFS